MSWLAPLLVAALTGAPGLVTGGVVANACANWNRISNFEGRVRYFVALMALPSKAGTEQWSEWLPRPRPGDPPWPDTKAPYRFRVARISAQPEDKPAREPQP